MTTQVDQNREDESGRISQAQSDVQPKDTKSLTWYETLYNNDNPETPAHGWIQWKGTDVCIDLHCICGTHGHIDGFFMYSVMCKDCGRKYAVGQTVKLIPLDTPELIKANEIHHDDYFIFSDQDNDPEAGMRVSDLVTNGPDDTLSPSNPPSRDKEE